MARRVWFKRTFPLGLPTFAHPEVVERLRGTPARLVERLNGLSREQSVKRPESGWSIQEQAGHMADLEPLWIGRVEDLLERKGTLRSADLDNRATWEAEHNRRPAGDILDEFGRRRRRFVELVEGLGERDLARTALHPRLRQPMSVVDLCYFVAEHDDHHLATITALRKSAHLAGT